MEVNEMIGKIRKSNITLVSKETGINSHRISVLLKFPSEMTKDEKEILNMYFSYPRPDEKTSKELNENVRENLRKLISTSKISQSKICEISGVGMSTLHRINTESYTGDFRMNVVSRLASVFNVSESELVFDRYTASWLNKKRITGEFKPWENLSRYFSESGMTKRQISEKTGIKYSSIHYYFDETDKYPNISTMLEFAKAMNIDPRLLFERVKTDKIVKKNPVSSTVSTGTTIKTEPHTKDTKNTYHLEIAVRKFYPDSRKIIITFKDGSLLVVRGLLNAIEAEFDSATSAVKTVKQTEDFKAFASDPKYVKILKVVALQNLFEKFGIKYKDLLKEISVIADL